MPKQKEKLDFWKLLILVNLILVLIDTYYLFTSSTASKFEVALNTTSTYPTGNFLLTYSPLAISLAFCLIVAGVLLFRSKII